MDNDTESYEDYYNYISLENETLPQDTVFEDKSIVPSLFLTAVVLLSLVGNVLVLVVLGLYKNPKSITNLFLLNLAVSDLIFALGLPFWACYYIWSWTFGDFMCKAVNFVLYVGFYSSTVFLMLMTIQSYVAVVHPQSDWNRWRPVVFPILAWVVSFSAALPHLLLSEVIPDPTDPSQLYCEYSSVSALTGVTYEQNAFFVVAFVVISVCFIRLYQTISKSQTRKEHRTITLIFCVVLVFFVSWAPYSIVTFLQTLTFHRIGFFTQHAVFTRLADAFYVCRLFAFSYCCVNPVIFIFAGKKKAII